jgi:hypothetical protein
LTHHPSQPVDGLKQTAFEPHLKKTRHQFLMTGFYFAFLRMDEVLISSFWPGYFVKFFDLDKHISKKSNAASRGSHRGVSYKR